MYYKFLFIVPVYIYCIGYVLYTVKLPGCTAYKLWVPSETIKNVLPVYSKLSICVIPQPDFINFGNLKDFIFFNDGAS